MNVELLKQALADDVTVTELVDDPFPTFERLQRDKPLAWSTHLNMWLVTRYDDVVHILENPDLFTAETEPSFLAQVLGANMLALEGDDAKRLKHAMMPPFTARGCTKDYINEELESFANQLIDQFVDKGEVELMSAYAEPIATHSLKRVLGFDDDDVSDEKMWRLCKAICAGIADFTGDPAVDAIFKPASMELEELIKRKIQQVRGRPDRSAISSYVNGGQDLSDQEIINNVRLMISGGINEPRDGIGMSVYAYLEHGQQVADHINDANFWLKFVGEVLRFYAPVGTAARMTTTTTEVCGTALPKGEFIAACLAAANRDPRAWDEPERFDPGRNTRKHMAFSHRQHRCLGLWLGLNEMMVGASLMLRRLPDIRLDESNAIKISGFEFRGPESLYLRW